MFKKLFLMMVATAVAALLLAQTQATYAHGHLEVGKYELVIGFKNEPAFNGELNGLDLRVTNSETGEPVTGLADTLQAELTFGSSSRVLEIRGVWGQDGAYTADVLPVEAGDYTWRIFGDIEGTPVDVSMTSSPDTFSAVRAKTDIAFPTAELTASELAEKAEAAAGSAQTAMIIAVIGLLVGIAGLVVGFLGFRAAKG